MTTLFKCALVICAIAVFALVVPTTGGAAEDATKDWALNTTIIEACSCPMFCQCYFNPEPAAHHGHGAAAHYCKFNMAHRVNKGHIGNVKLDGVKFWVSGDLGQNFGDGTADWAIVTFDPAVSAEQREAVKAALGLVYPVKWDSFSIAKDAPIEWKADADRAHAQLDAGKIAEIVLKRFEGMAAGKPAVMQNLRYFGAPRNDGFVMMPNEVQAFRVSDKAFETKGTTGFMITYDVTSKDAM